MSSLRCARNTFSLYVKSHSEVLSRSMTAYLHTRNAQSSQHSNKRDLPNPQTINWRFILPFGLSVGGAWYYFLLFATNEERYSASVVKQICSNVHDNSDVTAALGTGVSPEGAWWLVGNRPWISGKVEMPKGVVDVSFRIRGLNGSGTVYFTSVRKQKGVDFTNIRYKVITDDGKELDLLPSLQRETLYDQQLSI